MQELIKLMKALSDAGCKSIFYGIESGSNQVLKKINKHFTIEKADKVVLRSKKYFKGITCSFIYGFPFETIDDFNKTLTTYWAWRQKDIRCQLDLLTPYKFSRIYNDYRQCLKFKEEYSTGFTMNVWSKKTGLPRRIIKLIKEHPKVFSSFYYFDHAGLKEKRKKALISIKKMG